jgi:hypothetical protein
MRRALALVACLSLAACGTYVAQGTVDYNEAIEAETNQLLVINILRARDGVPTYYSDISQVRGTMSMGLQDAAILPIAAIGKSTTRGTSSTGATLQVSPSFDVAPLNTQDFTRGITEPLGIGVMQYYLDRGIPPEVLLFLLIDKIEVVKTAANGDITVEHFYNTPCSDRIPLNGPCSNEPGDTDRSHGINNRFYDKIQAWVPYLVLNAYTLMEPNGPPTKSGGAGKSAGGPSGGETGKSGGGAGGQATTLRPIGNGMYQEFNPSDRIAFCVPVATAQEAVDGRPSISISVSPSSAFKAVEDVRRAKGLPALYKEAPDAAHLFEIVAVPHTTTAGSPQAIADIPDPKACVRNLVYVRPADLLQGVPADMAPNATRAKAKAVPPPPAPQGPREYTVVYLRSVDGVVSYLGKLLRLADPNRRPLPFDISIHPHEHDRFTVSYDGVTYYVPGRGGAAIDGAVGPEDHDRTMDTLTLLNQLINLNKKASELPSTRAVQSVP